MGGKCEPLVHQWIYSLRNQSRPGAPTKLSLSQAIPAAHEGEHVDIADPNRPDFPDMLTDSSLNGLASAFPAGVADEFSASVAKPAVLMSAEKPCTPPAIAMPNNSRQVPFNLVQVIFMLFPLELMVSSIRVLPVIRKVRTVPVVTDRTVVGPSIRIGLR